MPVDATHVGHATRPKATTLTWVLPLLVAGGAFLALAKVLAGPLVLPLLSLLLLGAGFLIATVLFFAGSRTGRKGDAAWMVAGALVFLGFGAALLSDSHDTLAQLERMQAHGIATAGN